MESIRQQMRKAVTIIVAAMLLAACSPRIPLFEEVVASEMTRNPEASYIDGQQGKLKWNYTTGLELAAILDVYQIKDSKDGFVDMNDKLMRYVDDWYEAIIDECGNIYKYKKTNYSLDHICPGRTLFTLYDFTGKEKYRRTMDTLYSQLKSQPRTNEGGF